MSSSRYRSWCAFVLVLVSVGFTGCITTGYKSIPVKRLHPEWLGHERSNKLPIDFTLLRKDPPPTHIIEPRDIVGVYVQGVISGDEISSGGKELPQVAYPDVRSADLLAPSVGIPFPVRPDGTLDLPLIDPVNVQGLTLADAATKIHAAYAKQGIANADRKKCLTNVFLIRPRYNRVLVLREDTATPSPTLTQTNQQVLTKRGTGQVVQMVAYESDVLHTLIETGGLPGEDASNNIWVLKSAGNSWQAATQEFDQGASATDIAKKVGGTRQFIKIPLRIDPAQPIPFGPQDIALDDGDVVFVEARRDDFFYTAGLLSGGKVPLPRDEDVDILAALAIANVGIAGPAGLNAAASQFRSGPGNVIPPTRAIVVRSLPGGDQVKIDVNLRRALNDPQERILIKPGDIVFLHYRPYELLGNIALNFVNVGYTIPNNL